MFRLINNLNFYFSSKQYLIQSGKYLLETPPPKPINPYTAYAKDYYTKNINELKASEKSINIVQNSKIISQKWKNETEEIKKQYQNKFQQASKQYKIKKQQYEEKFVNPFKTTNTHAQSVKRIFGDPKNTALKIGRQVMQKVKQLDPKVLSQIRNQAKKKNQANKLLRKKYQFPQLQHLSLRSFLIKYQIKTQNLTPRQVKIAQSNAYNNYYQSWLIKVGQWLKLNNYEISIQQFEQLYKKDIRLKEKNAQIRRLYREEEENQKYVDQNAEKDIDQQYEIQQETKKTRKLYNFNVLDIEKEINKSKKLKVQKVITTDPLKPLVTKRKTQKSLFQALQKKRNSLDSRRVTVQSKTKLSALKENVATTSTSTPAN